MILLDNSEFMRNGDYIPTRLEAQQDAANLLVGAKTQSHPESTVGVSAGTELLVSPTEDVGKILGALHGMTKLQQQEDGELPNNVAASVQVASLALKHRRNKNGSQRIVLFVGSPLEGIETRTLTKAGRQLKKNNVSIDVVALGELEVNEPKLRELVEAANGRSDDGQRTCHLVTIPAGVLPSDVLASSPIVHGAGGDIPAAAAGGGGGGGGGGGDDLGAFAEFGGVDPNMDPELAMALRVSMEEERARQERAAAAAAAAEESKTDEPAASGDVAGDAEMTDSAAAVPSTPAPVAAPDLGLSEEEALLQQALAMSIETPTGAPAAEESKAEEATPMEAEEDDEDAAMQMALRMSMMPEGSEEEGKAAEGGQQFQDPQFVNQLLGSLPGVDPNDPQIQEALKNAQKDDKDEDKKDGDKKE